MLSAPNRMLKTRELTGIGKPAMLRTRMETCFTMFRGMIWNFGIQRITILPDDE